MTDQNKDQTSLTPLTTIKTNALKKGDRVILSNGWFATLLDNRKGNIRMAMVEGYYTEMGSVYAHDITLKQNDDGSLTRVELTPAQRKFRTAIREM